MSRNRSILGNITAEAFAEGAVRLVRSHQIHTVELSCPSEELRGRISAGGAFPFTSPSAIVVKARLLAGQSQPCDAVETSTCAENCAKNEGKVLTYFIRFGALSSAGEVEAAGSCYSAGETQLTAHWCSQLQRQFALCSALTGMPSRLLISLLPYVPHMSWCRDRDGILGAVRTTTMSSTVAGSDLSEKCDLGTGCLIQVALLHNAAIPLGRHACRHTAVLMLGAVDGEVCFSAASSNRADDDVALRKRMKRPRRTSVKNEINEEEESPYFFPLLTQFNEQQLLPAISWGALRAALLTTEGNCYDVCGVRDKMGCSCYLRGSLDAQITQSITLIVDAPRHLWRSVFFPKGCDTTAATCDNPLPARLAVKFAALAEAALFRLVYENANSFVHRLTVFPCTDNNDDVEGCTLGVVAPTSVPEGHQMTVEPAGHSCPHLVIQSIAESLAHIVRTSRNPIFVAEVRRLLCEHREGDGLPAYPADMHCKVTGPANVSDGVEQTAAILRWAVEARLLKW
uniref:Uncharacterized protein n=1 Tax=Trypanosoma congolense (strain IL3000) TaxID=1068625 RepID=G0UVR7_TRYCI|nr:conserved hypothetical protein [Trypanosoma congolense IL3000]